MSDYLELKRMVMSFRVSELQVLLGFAGRNKSGRKHELQARALALLKNNCNTPVEIKIKELNRRRFPRRLVSPPQVAVGNATSTQHNRHTNQTSERISPQNNNPVLPQFPQFYPYNSGQHNSQHLVQHIELTSPQPVRPDVKLCPLPFYDVQDDLVKPTGLVPSGKYRDVQRTVFFHLTPQQLQLIRESWTNNPRIEYSVQVQLRFCLAETSCEQDDKFPQSVCVKVNNKLCPLPPFLPQSKAGAEPKRPSRPVNITNLIRPNLTEPNRVDITWAQEFGRQYCVAIYLVKQLTSDILLQRLRSNGYRNADHTRALIKEKLKQDADSEIATTSLRVTLLCPLGKMRMQIPCRASTCTHLQCFDASLYLMMNEKKATWICPVCDKKAPFNLLVLDGLFQEIIQSSPDTNEIHFLQDGRWKPVNSGKEEMVVLGSATKVNKVDSYQDKMKSSTTASKPVSSSSNKPFSKTEVEFVDLTLSSDEESEAEVEEPVHVEPKKLDFTTNNGCVSPIILSSSSAPNSQDEAGSTDTDSDSAQTPTPSDPKTPENHDSSERPVNNNSSLLSSSILPTSAENNSKKRKSSSISADETENSHKETYSKTNEKTPDNNNKTTDKTEPQESGKAVVNTNDKNKSVTTKTLKENEINVTSQTGKSTNNKNIEHPQPKRQRTDYSNTYRTNYNYNYDPNRHQNYYGQPYYQNSNTVHPWYRVNNTYHQYYSDYNNIY